METASKTREEFVADAQDQVRTSLAEVREHLADVRLTDSAVGVMSSLRAAALARRAADLLFSKTLQLGLDAGLTLEEIGDSIEGLRTDGDGRAMQRGNVLRTLRKRGVQRRVPRGLAGA